MSGVAPAAARGADAAGAPPAGADPSPAPVTMPAAVATKSIGLPGRSGIAGRFGIVGIAGIAGSPKPPPEPRPGNDTSGIAPACEGNRSTSEPPRSPVDRPVTPGSL